MEPYHTIHGTLSEWSLTIRLTVIWFKIKVNPTSNSEAFAPELQDFFLEFVLKPPPPLYKVCLPNIQENFKYIISLVIGNDENRKLNSTVTLKMRYLKWTMVHAVYPLWCMLCTLLLRVAHSYFCIFQFHLIFKSISARSKLNPHIISG